MKRSALIALAIAATAMALTACDAAAGGDTKKSDDANLSALTVSAGTLDPAFSADVTAYAATVENDVATITVTGTPADENATVSATSGAAQTLAVGDNPIPIVVTAED